MADTSLDVTPGSGATIDMRSEATNGHLRQVVVLGDPATNAGVAAVDATNGLSVNVTNASLTVGSHAVTNAGTFAVQVSSIAAGTNAIGKLAANSGVDIGDTDVTSVIPGTGATNLGKAEDAAHTSGDVGVLGMTVRQDTAAALSGTDADYQPLITDGNGRLHVNVGNTVTVGSHAVTNAGTFAVQAAQSGTWSVTTTHGKTLKSKTGSASATFTLVAAVASKKIKVYSLSLITASTTAVTVTFKDGAGGTAVATYPLQAITGTNFGLTENVAVPSQLFETSAGTLLEMAFSAAQTVTYNLRYWDDDAS